MASLPVKSLVQQGLERITLLMSENQVGRSLNSSRQTRAVLDALSLRPNEWRHGYDLGKATGLRSGTLYPLLIRLHERGFLEAEWRSPGTPGRPARHVYRLSAAGRALAAERPSAPASLRLAERGA